MCPGPSGMVTSEEALQRLGKKMPQPPGRCSMRYSSLPASRPDYDDRSECWRGGVRSATKQKR